MKLVFSIWIILETSFIVCRVFSLEVSQRDRLATQSGSAKRAEGRRNSTVYLGFANNPFGQSTPFKGQSSTVKPDKHREAKQLNNNQTQITKAIDGASIFNVEEPRTKRGVVQLYNMVSCATGCDPLIYKGYGCYCGFLGSGRTVDGIDRCCKMHDICYNSSRCPPYLEYFVPYFWKCYRNKPLCAINQPGGYASCAQRLCECDRVLSECLSKYPCPKSRALCKSSPWRLLQNTLMIF